MSEAPAAAAHVEAPGPADASSALTRLELRRAVVWLGLAFTIVLFCLLIQPLLLIVGGLVFAAMLDGGTRLLGRVLPIGRGWRLLIVCLGVVMFLAWTVYLAGSQLGAQAEALRGIVQLQINRGLAWAQSSGLMPQGAGGSSVNAIASQVMSSLGRVTSWLGSALGAISSLAMIVVIGIFIAVEPRIYERGIAWMLPMEKRAGFYETSSRMAHTLRRLMFGRLIGMAVEGVFTGVLLAIANVPMATLLGILTGLLAFLPNIGAIVSGVLIILVGFAQGTDTGLYAIAIYVAVQVIDGYLIVPMVARRAVDLAPALVLGAQVLLGALLGILGLALADPIVAMLKVALERRSEGVKEA
jgi:predicted PurR-regulated permease PerM